ncbi:hypothetical protein ACN28I_10420 [Archangium gephyra]|uniref:hypothetical protein n=1 Tax=Archangium gephyra TaxID=48 RepID=UPI003B7A8751
MLQLVPSPNGAYQAVAMDCRKGASAPSTLLKVIRADETAACETRPLQEVTLTSGAQPRLAWMSDSALAIDERGAPPRPTLQGEVSFVFGPWQVSASPATPPATPPVVSPATPPLSVVPPVAPVCGFPNLALPTDFSVLAGGAYAGKASTGQIDQSGHAATIMTVSVDNPRKPVVLMLGAYEPTIWSIRRTEGTAILAVLASGYHRQIVTGLDATTPVAIHTYDNKSPCGFFYVDMKRLETLNPMARRFFGRDIDMVHPARDGAITMGVSQGAPTAWVGGDKASVESYIDKTAPLAGEAGLEDAVRKGLLRRADLGDRRQWEAEMERVASKRGFAWDAGRLTTLRANSSGTLADAYVVLRPMTLPAGLYGAHSAVFFVPKGTERPRGNPGHSSIYDFNDMSCTGAMCH